MSKKKQSNSKTALHIIIFFAVLILVIPNIYLKTVLDRELEPRLFSLALLLFGLLSFTIFNKKTKLFNVNFKILKSPFVLVYIAYIVVTGLSIFVAINKFEVIHEFLKLLTFFILFIYILLFIAPAKGASTCLTKIVVVLALIISLIGIVQYFNVIEEMGFSIKTAYKVTGNSAHKNLFSQLLFLTFSFSLFGIYYLKDIWKKLSFVAALANVLLITMLMTRSVWLALVIASICSIIIFFFSDLKNNFTEGKIKPFLKLAGIIVGSSILVFLLVSQIDSNKTIGSHIKEGTVFSSGSTFHRLALWKKTASLATENPILGVGAGNWKIAIVKKGTSLSSKSGWKNAVRAHSDYLWVLTEIGFPGFLLYLALFLMPLYFIIKFIKNKNTEEDKVFMLILFFAIVGFAVYSIFSFPKERIELQILLNVIFAFVIYKSHTPIDNNEVINKRIFKTVGIFLMFITLFAAISSYKRIQSEIGVQKIMKLRKQNKSKEVVAVVNDIYSKFNSLDYAANSILFSKGLAYLRLNKPMNEVIDLFLLSLKDHPYNIRTINGLAYVYQKNENNEEALKYCEKALEYSPNDFNTTILYAKIKGKIYGVDSAYNEIRKMKPKKHNKGYKKYLNNLLILKVNALVESISNDYIKKTLIEASSNSKFLINTYIESYNDNTDFEKVLLEKKFEKIADKQKFVNDSSIQILIKKYKISL